MSGPLAGLRVVEMLGLGPAPHACMMLADLGADVIQLRRPGPVPGPDGIVGADAALWRGRRVIDVDLKDDDQRGEVRQLIEMADVLVEGFRPGVMERLGLGPGDFTASAPRLIYARMTGWGQDGDLARTGGHDINYLALTGVLGSMGPITGPPVPPLSLVGDFGGGSMLIVVGVLAALNERQTSGRGQVIDAAMTDGAGLLAQLQWSWKAAGRWRPRSEGNVLDGSAPFYRAYACSDDRFVAVGALEEQFWTQLLVGLEVDELPDRWDRQHWPTIGEVLEKRFRTRTRDEWTKVFAGIDACVTPILDFDEAAESDYSRQRRSHVEVDGIRQAAPAPRFSRSTVPDPQSPRSADLATALDGWAGAP